VCARCGETLVRRADESQYNWQRRKFCSSLCVRTDPATYADLRWLLESGVAVYEALARCGVPNAEAAYQWALRHTDGALADRVRPFYNAEIAARHRDQRARRKAAT
jgi:hypothetical protein